MISVAAQEMPLVSDRMRLAAEALGRLGWDLRSVEIDLVAGRARIVLSRDNDGRLVTFDAGHGRVSVTREERVITHATVGRRGDRCPVERVSYRLLGRERFPGGVRAGLRYLPTPPAPPRPTAAIVAPTLAAGGKCNEKCNSAGKM